MKASDQPTGASAREAYEPPVVEDLETGGAPVETAPGVLTTSIPPTPSAPREL